LVLYIDNNMGIDTIYW